jgi:anti-sigma B factor antagonist
MALQETATRSKSAAASLAGVDVAILRCEGEMGTMELAGLGEELFRLAHRGVRKVVVDLARVEHVDYRGLKAMAARARLLRGAGGDLKLAGLSLYVATIFRAAGVEEEFQMYPTAEAAKLAFVDAPALALVRG